MNAYKIKTTITNDGKIILPLDLKDIFNHEVEVIVLDQEYRKNNDIQFGTYNLGGKMDDINIRDFAYED